MSTVLCFRSRDTLREAHVGQLDAALLRAVAHDQHVAELKVMVRFPAPPRNLRLSGAPREAHIGQLDAALLRAVAHDQHVAGLEVAVHDLHCKQVD